MGKIKQQLKVNGVFGVANFVLPVLILAFVYWQADIYLGSERSVLTSDSFTQYSHFLAGFHNVLKGEGSLLYTWYGSLGLNYWAFAAYYLGGIFTPLVYFFDNASMTDTYYLLTLLKFGCIGLSAWIFAGQTFKVPRWVQLILSQCYVLMSFTLVYSEVLMWLDAVMYLPLVILGIHRLMDQKKPTLLFVSYFLLFVSNFYMAFIVGVFSFLYYWARFSIKPREYKGSILSYFVTSFLAGGASMVVILPTIMDLQNNGEALSQAGTLKTDATSWWDLLVKNMVGVYDTTQYQGIPFIYAGLLPLLFALFYFVSKKFSSREKLAYGGLLGVLVASFYIEPLNLFWHGMHSPNMLLFRFSFLFSFLVILLAGYAWEKVEKADIDKLSMLLFIWIGLLAAFNFWRLMFGGSSYTYIYKDSFIYTFGFLIAYLVLLTLFYKQNRWQKVVAVGLVGLTMGELFLNTRNMIIGLGEEWGYPMTSLYEEPYAPLKELVDQTKEANDSFYRMENLDKLSENESFNFGYSGVSMFSSIRNRHSSIYMADLGFRSWGTQLSVRYDNNTILMDALTGIKYNISKEDPLKYGYTLQATSGEYGLYENAYAMPLGILTNDTIYEEDAVANQTLLFNQLSGQSTEYFDFTKPEITSIKNSEQTTGEIKGNETFIFKPKKKNQSQVITWQVKVPAKTQAYFSLYPTYHDELGSTEVKLEVAGQDYTSTINVTGQFYRLGYYEEETTVTFKTEFFNQLYEEEENWYVEMLNPNIVFLDTEVFGQAMEKMQDKGVNLKTEGRKVSGEVNLSEDQVLFTTIPYDKGWKAYVDGEEVEIPLFKEALLTLPLTAGKHTIEFVFMPQGFVLGVVLFVGCMLLFLGYSFWLYRRRTRIEGGQEPNVLEGQGEGIKDEEN
ncbi:YfhO family protein [Enterococcus sp. LJL128]